MHYPDAATSAIKCIDNIRCLDQYDLSIAYLVDIEARAQRFIQEYPNCNVYEVDIGNCDDIDYIFNLFSNLKITPTSLTRKIYTTNFNKRSNRKKLINNSVDIDQCKERINLYFEKAEKIGIKIPQRIKITNNI